MQTNITKLLLRLKDKNLKITNYNENYDIITVDIELNDNKTACTKCGSTGLNIDDYRIRKIKHGNFNGYNLILNYKRVRFM